MQEPRATVQHMRSAGLCVSGSRAWCAVQGLSWRQFVREGLPVSTLEATGDPYALRVAAAARESTHGG